MQRSSLVVQLQIITLLQLKIVLINNQNKVAKNQYIGKIRANHHKSQYIIFDNGSAAKQNSNPDNNRKETGFIYYKNQDKKSGCRNLVVGLPLLTQEKMYQPVLANKETDICNLSIDRSKCNMFTSKSPWLDENTGKYLQSFSTHTKISSVKNFQLINMIENNLEEDINEEVMFEFGKINNTEYSLIFKHPFSILNAFGIALSCFDK